MNTELNSVRVRTSRLMQAISSYAELLEMLSTKIQTFGIANEEKLASYYGQASMLCSSAVGLLGVVSNALMAPDFVASGQVTKGWVFEDGDLRDMTSAELQIEQEKVDNEDEEQV